MAAGRLSRLVGLGNMGLRAGALVARFALSIYLARALGFAALGTFGLIAGVAGVLPSVLGFGVGYHVNRELLHAPREDAYRLLRDRMAMSAVLVVVAGVLAVASCWLRIVEPPPWSALITAIVALEVVAFDLHVSLLNLGRPMLANLLLFVRSASWIAPVIVAGVLWPSTRSLGAVFGCWLAALVVNFALLPVLLRDLRWRALWSRPVDWRALARHARATPLVYVDDVAQTAQVYLDRFVVAQQLGIAATGTYTLLFSVSHGVYLLTAAATTQLAPRRLVAALAAGGRPGWRAAMRGEAVRAAVTGVAVAAPVLVATLLILPRLGFASFGDHAGLFALMIAGALVRPLADLALNGLYLARADRMLATINLAGVVASVAAGLAATAVLGLPGIGLTSLLMPLSLLGARLACLRRVESDAPTGKAPRDGPAGSASPGS